MFVTQKTPELHNLIFVCICCYIQYANMQFFFSKLKNNFYAEIENTWIVFKKSLHLKMHLNKINHHTIKYYVCTLYSIVKKISNEFYENLLHNGWQLEWILNVNMWHMSHNSVTFVTMLKIIYFSCEYEHDKRHQKDSINYRFVSHMNLDVSLNSENM